MILPYPQTPKYIGKGEGNVALVPNIKAYVGMEVHCHSFITLALVGDKWSVTCFTLEGRAFGTL